MANWSQRLHCELNIHESALAFDVAGRRLHNSHAWNSKDTHGANEKDYWLRHIEGAMAECAFAKAFGFYWPGSVNSFKTEPDVDIFEVRWRFCASHNLLIRPNDPPDRPYVLVVGHNGSYDMVGYCYGTAGMQPGFLKTYDPNRPPAYFVPQEALHNVDDILAYRYPKREEVVESGFEHLYLCDGLLPPQNPKTGYVDIARCDDYPLPNHRDRTLREVAKFLRFSTEQTNSLIQKYGYTARDK
jgi:hypothetical protein